MKDLFALETVGNEVQFLYLYLLFIHKLQKLQACLYFTVICFAHQIASTNQCYDYVMAMWPLLVFHWTGLNAKRFKTKDFLLQSLALRNENASFSPLLLVQGHKSQCQITMASFSEVILKFPGNREIVVKNFDLLSSTWLLPWIWKLILMFCKMIWVRSMVNVFKWTWNLLKNVRVLWNVTMMADYWWCLKRYCGRS